MKKKKKIKKKIQVEFLGKLQLYLYVNFEKNSRIMWELYPNNA